MDFFVEAIQLFVRFLQPISLVQAEDDDCITAVLAVQIACARRPKYAVGFTQVRAHGEGNLQNLVARRIALPP